MATLSQSSFDLQPEIAACSGRYDNPEVDAPFFRLATQVGHPSPSHDPQVTLTDFDCRSGNENVTHNDRLSEGRSIIRVAVFHGVAQ